jgi:phosphonate C-P lyase system protein PhnG
MELSCVLAAAPREKVLQLADLIGNAYPVVMIKPPIAAPVTLTVREPVKDSRFLLEKTLATECILEINGHRGTAKVLGDDSERAKAIAILDAAYYAGVPLMHALNACIRVMELELFKEQFVNIGLRRQMKLQLQIAEDGDV